MEKALKPIVNSKTKKFLLKVIVSGFFIISSSIQIENAPTHKIVAAVRNQNKTINIQNLKARTLIYSIFTNNQQNVIKNKIVLGILATSNKAAIFVKN